MQKPHNQGMSSIYPQRDLQKMTVTGRKRMTLSEFHAITNWCSILFGTQYTIVVKGLRERVYLPPMTYTQQNITNSK